VARINEKQVPLIAVVETRQRARQTDDHLLDAAPLATHQTSVNTDSERGGRTFER
jgi:hypothetical protein